MSGGLVMSSNEEEEDDWCETGGNTCNMTLECSEGILHSITYILMVSTRAKGDWSAATAETKTLPLQPVEVMAESTGMKFPAWDDSGYVFAAGKAEWLLRNKP